MTCECLSDDTFIHVQCSSSSAKLKKTLFRQDPARSGRSLRSALMHQKQNQHALRCPPLVEEGRLPFVRCLPMLPASLQLRSGGRAAHVLGILPNRRRQRQEEETVVCICVIVQEEKEDGTVNTNLGINTSISISITTTKTMRCNTSPLGSQRQANVSGGRHCICGRQIAHALGGHYQKHQAPAE